MLAGSVWRALALTAVLVTGLAGCGSQAGGPPAARPGTPAASPTGSVNPGGPVSPVPSVSPPAATPSPGGTCRSHVVPFPAGATIVLTLRNSSNGGTFCVQAGQRVDVYLTAPPGQRWAPVRSDSSVLVPMTHGHLAPTVVGVTTAFFAALRPGVAHLSTARRVCAAKPVRCDALIAFRATVIVTRSPAS
ncbi:MAG TPA: hypothetical protein VMH35_23860 [Streptosporangiaceae bacterium]|nr:hypothetical protein [Streptosporangiaceae bacterium]